ncbi:hypothetical protein GW17_00034823 [Ensete ventricosum]|uniref:Uncharacterized protein n=1 Tax=Ensete ventricosum TaxID=4639 RepID=A0A444DVE4_ENSVE|nr:hypothetical protein GW17_00034823 [Ensete ventricosum]RZR74965.1 hypothetical protein BHM03_00046790 [Ensete ventricosum]
MNQSINKYQIASFRIRHLYAAKAGPIAEGIPQISLPSSSDVIKSSTHPPLTAGATVPGDTTWTTHRNQQGTWPSKDCSQRPGKRLTTTPACLPSFAARPDLFSRSRRHHQALLRALAATVPAHCLRLHACRWAPQQSNALTSLIPHESNQETDNPPPPSPSSSHIMRL